MPRPLKVTPAVSAVMRVILDASPESPAWGLAICDATGRGPGTVYPALDKLMQAGWITRRWEPDPGDRPRRLFYEAAYRPHWYDERIGVVDGKDADPEGDLSGTGTRKAEVIARVAHRSRELLDLLKDQ